MVKLKNPLFIAALLLAFLFYSGMVPVKKNDKFFSFIDHEKIIFIEGYLTSNPVKSPLFNSSYRASFIPEKTFSPDAYSQAKGEVILYFPCNLIEAYYPGKLYSSIKLEGKKAFLAESGARLKLKVASIKKEGFNDSYMVEGGSQRGWQGNFIISNVRRFRALCRLQFKRLMYSWNEAGGLLLALLTGSREYTEKEVAKAFRESGLSHILALSGMHLGLFGSIARFIGRKVRGRNLGDGVQLIAVLIFVWFAGISPSLFRAFLAALILYLNSLLRMNRPDSLSLLSFCFILHSVIFPGHIHEAAFMLSYASLTGIILFNRTFIKIIPLFLPHKIRISLSQSLSAQTGTAPVALKLFSKLMPQGIIASLFVAPLVFLFLYLGLFSIIICLLLPFLSGPISVIMGALYLLIKRFVLFFSFT
ncbi:MAG: ComEC/Rec2 family competence protein [Treponema sp.]|nr:ComEC/Rec2 family competence protein [Treponema sp.]